MHQVANRAFDINDVTQAKHFEQKLKLYQAKYFKKNRKSDVTQKSQAK